MLAVLAYFYFIGQKTLNLLCTFLTQKCCPLKYCQAQSQLQVKLSLKTELALISVNPATPPPPTNPPPLPSTRESLFSNISQ